MYLTLESPCIAPFCARLPFVQLETALPWLALSLTKGIAARFSARLLEECGSPDAVFRASLKQLEACDLPAATAQAVVKEEAFKRAEKELAALRTISCAHLINWTEPEYPQTLLQIYDPPVLLYVRGDPQILNAPSLAIVGTRRPTLYGTQMADRLGRELAAGGIVIVSGLARGIDGIAHQGAVAVEGRDIGVLGTGIDVCYPKESKKTPRKSSGARLHPQRASAAHPPRARKLSRAQPHRSRHVARRHHRRRRAVFRLSDHGAAGQAVSFAPNLLIKQGAKLVINAGDVIEELPTPVRAALTKPEQPEPRPIDDIVKNTGLNSSDVLATLFDLEMKGFVRQLPGKLFSKVLL